MVCLGMGSNEGMPGKRVDSWALVRSSLGCISRSPGERWRRREGIKRDNLTCSDLSVLCISGYSKTWR